MKCNITSICFVSTVILGLGACQPKSDGNAAPANATTETPALNEGNVAAANTAQAVIPAGCQIKNALDWKARVDAQGPVAPRLGVGGTVVFGTAGYKADLARKGTDFNPRIVTLELTITPPAPGTVVSQVESRVAVAAKVQDVVRDLEKVVINCGGAKLTEITNIEVTD